MGRRKRMNGVREVFDIEADGTKSKCSVCSQIVPGSHLGNLRNHLTIKHPDVLQELETDNDAMPEEPAPKKQKITLVYDPNDIIESWLDLVVKEGRPFTTLDSPALRRLVGPIFKALDIDMLNSHNVAKAIKERAEKVMKAIKELCTNRMFSIKIDSATRHTRRVIIVNIQLICKSKIEIRTIAVKEIPVKHTGKNIKAFVLAVLEE